MSSAALRLMPAEQDDLIVESGIVAMQCSPGGPDALARALRLDRTRGYQLRRGDRSGSFFRALDLTGSLTCGDGTTAAPLLVAMRTIVLKRQLMRQDSAQLTARWAQLDEEERMATARLEAARDHRDRAAERQAFRELAATYEEKLAIDEVMSRMPGRPDPRKG